MLALIKRYWFLIALGAVFTVTLADRTGTVSSIGQWLKVRHGPDIAVVLIFLASGILLEIEQVKAGLKDLTGTIAALGIIFIIAPLTALAFAQIPLQTGILIGIFLVAVMPTTLSSGVVMTGAAGGNTAHALFITILANTIAVFSVPVALSLLLPFIGGSTTVMIDRWHIMVKLFSIVLLPLCGGMAIKYFADRLCIRIALMLQVFNQSLILVIVWMGISQARQAIFEGGRLIGGIILLSFLFHGVLLAAAWGIAHAFSIGRGRRESLIFMGAQKTLPLSIILQVALFPQYGQALVFCVVHHIVHLIMDGYLVGKMKA
jgi:sodium/bile acid cotransporter 7